MPFRGRLWVKFNTYKPTTKQYCCQVRPSKPERRGICSPNPKENEGKIRCSVSSARTHCTLLTLLNHGSQEAECRKYIWGGREHKLGQEFLPCRLGSCSVRIMWCPEMGSVGIHSARCTQHFPNCLDLRTFSPWDTACHGKRFQKLHESLFKWPNVTTVASRPLHAFCITHDAPRALIIFPCWKEEAQETGCSVVLCGGSTGNPGLFKTE